MKTHWSDRMVCSCGMSFRSISAEAVHRHNFPVLCRKPKGPRKRPAKKATLAALLALWAAGAQACEVVMLDFQRSATNRFTASLDARGVWHVTDWAALERQRLDVDWRIKADYELVCFLDNLAGLRLGTVKARPPQPFNGRCTRADLLTTAAQDPIVQRCHRAQDTD